MAEIDENVTVWTTDDGVPIRLIWRATRYHVTDTPTVWADVSAWWRPFGEQHYGVGSLPREIGGWRFQGTDDSGTAHVFDIRHDDVQRSWQLVRIFD